ncbi:MAG: FGGY-family carbohydrate kinase, partial [Bacteroidota bacterium]
NHPFENIGEMIEAAAKVESEGLQFLPFVFGERAPIWDANASGSFTGIRSHHQPAQFARAALEGVCDNIVVILRQLEKAIGPVEKIVAGGGFTASPFWLDMLTKKSNRHIEIAPSNQTSAYGAALMVRLGLQEVNRIEEL